MNFIDLIEVKIGTHDVSKQYDEWMDVWRQLTQESMNSPPPRTIQEWDNQWTNVRQQLEATQKNHCRFKYKKMPKRKKYNRNRNNTH